MLCPVAGPPVLVRRLAQGLVPLHFPLSTNLTLKATDSSPFLFSCSHALPIQVPPAQRRKRQDPGAGVRSTNRTLAPSPARKVG